MIRRAMVAVHTGRRVGRAGMPVLVDKPLATSVADAEAMRAVRQIGSDSAPKPDIQEATLLTKPGRRPFLVEHSSRESGKRAERLGNAQRGTMAAAVIDATEAAVRAETTRGALRQGLHYLGQLASRPTPALRGAGASCRLAKPSID